MSQSPEHTRVVYSDETAIRAIVALEEAATAEQGAPETVRRPRGIRGQRVVHRLRYVAGIIDDSLPGVRENDVGLVVECLDATFEQFAADRTRSSAAAHLKNSPRDLIQHEVVIE